MEASPCRFASERYWTEEKERALIAFFSKHSCLWNHKSENYKNRQLRWKTLEHLRILLSSQPPPAPFTVEDIKNKFKNLRTTFQRQAKLVRASKVMSSDPFVPQWKHYQQLMFLQDCWDQDNVPEEPPLSPLADPPEENKPTLTPTGLISFLPSLSASSTMTASSCVPSNILVKSYWTEDRERALISFYAEHSCLWSKKSENHNNRQLRQKLLELLRSQLSDHLVSFSVDDIKCKFKNLRTVFNREHKSMQASRILDKPYVSKWKHYHHLLFLCESGDEDESPDDLQILMMHEAKDLENGSPAPSSTLSSSIQTNNKLNNALVLSRSSQSESQTSTSAGYQILLPTAPDHLKPSSHTAVSTLPASPSRSLPDRNSSGNPSLLMASCLVRPDVRLTSDSRCLWSEAKVQQLISFYSEHSCLWNHKLESYRNRVLRQSLLERLSGLLSEHEPVPFSVEDIKTKFRNLRTIFQREHKAVSSNRTCGSEDFYLPKWKHYHDLMFLCDSCDEDDERPEESGLLCFDSPSPSLHYPSTNQTAPNLTITRMNLEAPPSPTPPDSQLCSPSTSSPSMSSSSTSSPSTASSHVDSRVSGRKRAGSRLWASTSELMKSVCQNRTESPHAGFLKYVEECLNETPPDKVKKLKKTIIEMIHSVAEDV